MSNHTKGSWSIEPGNPCRIWDEHHLIGTTAPAAVVRPEKECIANAALMAAAPDLLKSLKAVRQWAIDGVKAELNHAPPDEAYERKLKRVLAAMDAAIKKAGG